MERKASTHLIMPQFLYYHGPVASVLDCQSRCSGFKSRPGQKLGSRFLLHLHPLANSATMSTLTVHCQWEDETERERTGHPPSYADAKNNSIYEVANTSYPWLF